MDKNNWRSYFQFTRKERMAVIVLLVMIVAAKVAPIFFKSATGGVVFEPLNQHTAGNINREKRQALDDSSGLVQGEDGRFVDSNETVRYSLFYFDPNNTLDTDWRKLGLRDRTIQTIQKFLDKGGRFRIPDDLRKIYGIRRIELERLIPYVRISKNKELELLRRPTELSRQSSDGEEPGVSNSHWPRSSDRSGQREVNRYSAASTRNYRMEKSSLSIDINEADSSQFILLPGIGPKLAARIIQFRAKLGGFYSVDQVAETYGIVDSVFQRFKLKLVCHPGRLAIININTSTLEPLKQHPYIRWKLAEAIIRYREQHGPFKKVEDLLLLHMIDEAMLAKLLPYLSVE